MFGEGACQEYRPDWATPPPPYPGKDQGRKIRDYRPVTDTHLWKHYLIVVVRTQAVINETIKYIVFNTELCLVDIFMCNSTEVWKFSHCECSFIAKTSVYCIRRQSVVLHSDNYFLLPQAYVVRLEVIFSQACVCSGGGTPASGSSPGLWSQVLFGGGGIPILAGRRGGGTKVLDGGGHTPGQGTPSQVRMGYPLASLGWGYPRMGYP